MDWREQVTEGIAGLLSESLAKAAEPNRRTDEPVRRTTEAMIPAGAAQLPPEPATDDTKSLLYDPFALIDQLGYRDRPTGLTYETLREMAKKVPTYTSILQTRLTQVKSFGQRQTDERDPGFGVVLRDSKRTPTRKDEQRMRDLEDWLLLTGTPRPPNRPQRPSKLRGLQGGYLPGMPLGQGRDDFKTFLHKLTRDALILDQGCFEIVRNKKGLPAEFYAMDGATMRLADVPPGAETEQDPQQVKYVQTYDEIIISEFAAHEMCFGVRNPRTDIRVNGYGFSELEMLINVITATLWSFEYNRRFFGQGTAARGILNFKGSVPDKKIDNFRRQWKMMIAGVNNAHRTPMTSVDDVQWIDLHSSNRDMEFSAWMDWLIKVTCAVCAFDPAEINFNYGNTGQSSQMFATPVESKVKESKDKGLKPLLQDLAQWLNTHLIWPLDPNFEFQFLGLTSKSADQSIDLAMKESKYKKTVDEIRAEDDLPPLPDGKGAVILDPTWLQFSQAADMAAQQEEMGQAGMGGEEDAQPGDVIGMAQGGAQEPTGDVSEGVDFESLFGNGEKSLRGAEQVLAQRRALEASRIHGEPGSLRKSRKRATVKVYEIEL
jgi:hypothetical protein